MHHISAQNELLEHEKNALMQALKSEKQQNQDSRVLDLQRRQEYNTSSVLWSPRKVREAQFRERIRQQELRQEEQQKAQRAEERAAKKQHKQLQTEERRVAREAAKLVREK